MDADTPNQGVKIARRITDKALDAPVVGETLAKLGGSIPSKAERNPASFDRFVRSEIARWAPILAATRAER